MSNVHKDGLGVYVQTNLPCSEAKERVQAALKEEGFGILTQIDVQATLKEKIGADIPPYTILGACNPKLAHRSLQAEPRVGLMLPCNVVVEEQPGGAKISALDPGAMMGVFDNPALEAVAAEARERIVRALATLA